MVDSFKDIIKEIKEEVLSSKCNLEVYARVITVSNTEGDENTIYLQVSLQTEKTAFLSDCDFEMSSIIMRFTKMRLIIFTKKLLNHPKGVHRTPKRILFSFCTSFPYHKAK